MRLGQLTASNGGFVPARLTIAREAQGIKQNELAEIIGVAPATVSKWENPEYSHAPDVGSIDALSKALAVKHHWFFKPYLERHFETAFYRSMRSELAIARNKASAKLFLTSEIFCTLDQVIEFPRVDIPDVMGDRDYRTITPDTIEDMALRVREYWGLSDDPISDLMTVIENAGVIVAESYLDSNKLDGVSAWIADRPIMLLAKDKEGGVRRRFDAAHELAHLVMHRGISQEALAKDIRLIEEQAMLFAGAFLMPGSSFAEAVRDLTLDYLADIKPRWGVSIGAMIKRLGTLELISEESERKFWKYYSYRKWRGREPHDQTIHVERPENLRSAFIMFDEDDPAELVSVMEEIAVEPRLVEELVGTPITLENTEKPKLQLVKSDTPRSAAND